MRESLLTAAVRVWLARQQTMRLAARALCLADDLRANRERPLAELQADLHDLRADGSARWTAIPDSARRAALGTEANRSAGHTSLVTDPTNPETAR